MDLKKNVKYLQVMRKYDHFNKKENKLLKSYFQKIYFNFKNINYQIIKIYDIIENMYKHKEKKYG